MQWPDVLRNYDKNALHPEAAGPGHWKRPGRSGPAAGRDLTALWHSEFSPVHTPLPISLTIDVGSPSPIYGLTYQPRLDGTPTGTITSYQIDVSTGRGPGGCYVTPRRR